jgi:hypothetical protein
MTSYRSETLIEAPIEVVFDYVSDLRKHGEWAQHQLRIEPAAETKTNGAGAAFASTAHQMGLDTKNSLVITEVQWPLRFAFEAEGREGRFRHSFDLEPAGGGTRLTKAFEVLHWTLLAMMAAPVFAWLGPRNLRKDLQRIKARIESRP